MAEAEAELNRFEIEIRSKAPGYAHIAYPEPIELEGLQRILRRNETLLRYFFTFDRALLWVVQRDGARVIDLGDPARIEHLVDKFLQRARNPGAGLASRPEGERTADELARALLGPKLPPGHGLLVVPDGPLHQLPFGTLRRAGRYLIEDHETTVVPSATALRLMRESGGGTAAGGFLGIGNPLAPAGGTQFPELPFSERALHRISELFAEDDRVVLHAEEATRKSIEEQPLDTFRIVHFATHGWSDSADASRVALRLSPPDGSAEAGFLHVNDVFQMTLSAELVVLAGCRTGLGEVLPGEGPVGLTRAFLYAGAQSVLVSLWNVSDRSAAEFMEAFYRELDGRTIPEALRLARLSFLQSDRPALRQFYRWAPFVLVGDPGSTAIRLNPAVQSSEPGERGSPVHAR